MIKTDNLKEYQSITAIQMYCKSNSEEIKFSDNVHKCNDKCKLKCICDCMESFPSDLEIEYKGEKDNE